MPQVPERVPYPTRLARSLVRMIAAASMVLAITTLSTSPAAVAQDLTQFLDLKSDEFTKADLSRADIEAMITGRTEGQAIDLSARRLNKLDL